MRVLILLTAYLLYAAHAAPQFLTFKDGKVGVNFGGYHAEAGLGGLLTGNAMHGGLSASAGTPWGQNAAAGIGGGLDGSYSGLGYAGAQAIPSVGASAVLGGTSGNGFIGSEAHANGKIHSNVITSGNQPLNQNYEPQSNGPVLETRSDVIQKIKPPKKYSLFKTEETHSPNAPAEKTDHTPIVSGSGDTAGAHTSISTGSNSNSNSNPTTMIHLHRQRMRERRRLQQQQQEAQNELEQRRANEHRLRTRQRLHQRQHVVARSKDIVVYPPTAQQTDNTDVNAVHSKHLVKSFHKSVNTQADAQAPASPGGPNTDFNVHYSSNPGLLNNALNIPIGILRTIQESLTGIQVDKNISVSG